MQIHIYNILFSLPSKIIKRVQCQVGKLKRNIKQTPVSGNTNASSIDMIYYHKTYLSSPLLINIVNFSIAKSAYKNHLQNMARRDSEYPRR